MAWDSGNFFRTEIIYKSLPASIRFFAFRKGGQMDPFLDLDKIFDPSNGGMIEMVQLPDIFLEHPTVSVTVSN